MRRRRLRSLGRGICWRSSRQRRPNSTQRLTKPCAVVRRHMPTPKTCRLSKWSSKRHCGYTRLFIRSLGGKPLRVTKSAGGISQQELWDEPDRFEPERFCRERSNKRPRYAYIPFSGGPRVCIGAAFAMIEGVLALAQIGQRYRFRLVEEHRVEPRGLLTLHPKNGLNVCLVPRYPSNQAAGR